MKKVLLYVLAVIAVIIGLTGVLYGYTYSRTPEHLRHPKFDHFHFRTQLVINGKAVNFAEDKFQETLPGVCSIDLTESPIHFHDNLDQMTHIHWQNITGGELLKYYGWNFIGGQDDSLGNRFDRGWLPPKTVPTLGKLLPEVPAGSNYYVYTGDKQSYQRKDWNEFLGKTLENFFGKQSSVQPAETSSLLDRLFPKAYAHGTVEDDHSETGEPKTEEELTRINNLLGNLVIFVQPNEPTPEEIQAKFSNLVPLQDSTCGG